MLGIGASSSAAYTLRKHYSKFILGFECQFDRGGADPVTVMQQAEVGTKKKAPKNTSVPSPGKDNAINLVRRQMIFQRYSFSGWLVEFARLVSGARS